MIVSPLKGPGHGAAKGCLLEGSEVSRLTPCDFCSIFSDSDLSICANFPKLRESPSLLEVGHEPLIMMLSVPSSSAKVSTKDTASQECKDSDEKAEKAVKAQKSRTQVQVQFLIKNPSAVPALPAREPRRSRRRCLRASEERSCFPAQKAQPVYSSFTSCRHSPQLGVTTELLNAED